MKILELHIRNIASILKADIDFEHDPGLLDPDTGQPAQKFLIYGDTGTGKSVLLDAIAMALFGTTPRLNEVANKVQNYYRTNTGQQVAVNNLHQYTRIGITAKDECYSHVRFEGNDGVLYDATYTLGYNRRGNPREEWLVRSSDGREANQVRTCTALVGAAIGMSFDQFCRLVMLAQGQFSAFLCGERDERAQILEKLTNTEKFSLYGRAIANIAARKQDECRQFSAVVAEQQGQLMPAEQVEELTRQRAQTEVDAQAVRQAQQQTSALLDTLRQHQHHTNALQQAAAEMAQVQDLLASDEYKQQTLLVAEWDATAQQRTDHAALQQRIQQQRQAQLRLNQLEATFGQLSANLDQQFAELRQQSEQLRQQADWLDQRADRAALYAQAAVVDERLHQYMLRTGKCAEARRALQANQEALPQLQQAEAATAQQCATAQQEVDAVQRQVDAVIAQLAALGAANLPAEQQALSARRASLDGVARQMSLCSDLRTKHEQTLQALTALQKQCAEAASQHQACQAATAEAEQASRQAEQRYNTFHASVDEMMVKLRHQLAASHIDTCPLCGGHVEADALHDDDFAALVAPLEQEYKTLREAWQQAVQHEADALRHLSSLQGATKQQTTESDREGKQLAQQEQTLANLLAEVALQPTDTLPADLAQARTRLEQQQVALQQRSSQCAALQRGQADLAAQLQPLLAALNTAQANAKKASLALAANQQTSQQLQADAADAEHEATTLGLQLDEALLPHYPWRDDPAGTRTRLSAEAKQFLDQQQQHAEQQKGYEEQLSLATRIDTEYRIPVVGLHPNWKSATDAPARPATVADWHQLWQSHTELSATLQRLDQEVLSLRSTLDAWAIDSGKEVEYLSTLAAREAEVAPARQWTQQLAARHMAAEATLQRSREAADNSGAELRRGLRHTLLGGIVRRGCRGGGMQTLLEVRLQRLSARWDECSRHLSQADTLLAAYHEATQRLQSTRQNLERVQAEAAHWDTLNSHFGGKRFRNLVQTHILHPLLDNANIYLHQITDRYTLTCSEENEQLAILVHDRYNRDEVRSAAVLSGGERFMVSLALSLALSSLGRQGLAVNILFIDEGFGTLDQETLDSVMTALSNLAQSDLHRGRRVGIISHREELTAIIPNKIKVRKVGEGRSLVEVVCEL